MSCSGTCRPKPLLAGYPVCASAPRFLLCVSLMCHQRQALMSLTQTGSGVWGAAPQNKYVSVRWHSQPNVKGFTITAAQCCLFAPGLTRVVPQSPLFAHHTRERGGECCLYSFETVLIKPFTFVLFVLQCFVTEAVRPRFCYQRHQSLSLMSHVFHWKQLARAWDGTFHSQIWKVCSKAAANSRSSKSLAMHAEQAVNWKKIKLSVRPGVWLCSSTNCSAETFQIWLWVSTNSHIFVSGTRTASDTKLRPTEQIN